MVRYVGVERLLQVAVWEVYGIEVSSCLIAEAYTRRKKRLRRSYVRGDRDDLNFGLLRRIVVGGTGLELGR